MSFPCQWPGLIGGGPWLGPAAPARGRGRLVGDVGTSGHWQPATSALVEGAHESRTRARWEPRADWAPGAFANVTQAGQGADESAS